MVAGDPTFAGIPVTSIAMRSIETRPRTLVILSPGENLVEEREEEELEEIMPEEELEEG
jgi:hypothetical protein